jgi:hypothetical protein
MANRMADWWWKGLASSAVVSSPAVSICGGGQRSGEEPRNCASSGSSDILGELAEREAYFGWERAGRPDWSEDRQRAMYFEA